MKGRAEKDSAGKGWGRVAAVGGATRAAAAGTSTTTHAAVPTGAAECLVAEKGAVGDREGRAAIVDSARWAITAIATGPARTARTARSTEGSVSEERAVCHGHGRGGKRHQDAGGIIGDGAAHTIAGVAAVLAGPAVGPVAPSRQVALESAVQHRCLAAASISDGTGNRVA